MHTNTRTTNQRGLIVLAALLLVALVGGSAFTNANTMPADDTVGYGTTAHSGAEVTSITHNLNAAGDNVDSVTLVLAGDTTGSAVSVGFNGGDTTSCGTGTFAATETTYTCDNGGTPLTQSTSGLLSTAVVVS